MVDNLVRRKTDVEQGTRSLVPIATMEQRLRAWKETTGKTIEFIMLDIADDYAGFDRLLQERRPDLLVLDLMLPDMAGTDICRKIRNDPDLADVPVIMLTARADEVDRVVGFELGADDYVTKPFSPRELVLRVRERPGADGDAARLRLHCECSAELGALQARESWAAHDSPHDRAAMVNLVKPESVQKAARRWINTDRHVQGVLYPE